MKYRKINYLFFQTNNQSHQSHRATEPQTPISHTDSTVKQEEEPNASDDDQQMVICEDAQPDIDLKTKDKMTESDNDMKEEDVEKNFTQPRYSPVSGQKREQQNAKGEVTCRPKPIKGKQLIKQVNCNVFCFCLLYVTHIYFVCLQPCYRQQVSKQQQNITMRLWIKVVLSRYYQPILIIVQ